MNKEAKITSLLFLILIIVFFMSERKQYISNQNLEKDITNSISEIINNNIINNSIKLKEINSFLKKYNDYEISQGYFSSLYNEIIIDKGSYDGIKRGSVVINQDGLVGFISKIYKKKSIVSLLNNYNEEISIKINDNYGVLKSKNGKLIVTGINSSDVSFNDKVYTSGLTNILEGIYIGYVNDIKDKDDIFKTELEIKQNLNFNNYKFLAVLENE